MTISWRVVIAGSLFAFFSSFILSYVLMAAMIGPWIAPTLVLIMSLVLRLRKKQLPEGQAQKEMALSQAVGSVGAIVGMGMGFALPTLFFLDADAFDQWIAHPGSFALMLGVLCIAAGGLGIYFAHRFSQQFIVEQKLKFPVSQLIYRMITSQSQGAQARNMILGFSTTSLFCVIRDGIGKIPALLPRTWYVLPSLLGRHGALALFLGPTLWAVGFTTGAMIAVPLIVGMLSKYVIMQPLNFHSTFVPWTLFAPLPLEEFTMAFCSGMVVSGAAAAMVKYPKIIMSSVRAFKWDRMARFFSNNMMSGIVSTSGGAVSKSWGQQITEFLRTHGELVFSLALSVAFLWYYQFSVVAQLFLIVSTILIAYQISLMGARIGLVPFGRFATFVMIPMLFLFRLDAVQLTLLCTFVNVCGGVASDLLFDYKVGELCGVSFDRVRRYQWLGLLVTAASIGLLLWLIFTHFQIGTPELFCQRGKTRALLIQATNFNLWVLLFGAIYGYVLKKCKVSPALVLGGILMNNSISIGLIIGGLLSKVVKQPEDKFPFWSGVFAAESLWILLCISLKMLHLI